MLVTVINGSQVKKYFPNYIFMIIFYDICAFVEAYKLSFTPPLMFIVGNQLDSGVMVRLAMGGLLNGI